MQIIDFPIKDRSIDPQQLRKSVEAGVRAAFAQMSDKDILAMMKEPFDDFGMKAAA